MKIIGQLSTERVCAITDHIRALAAVHARPEQARCARGRLHFWLNWEPIYHNKAYVPGLRDQRLEQYLSALWPEYRLAQVYLGNRGIGWHRDASYASPDARILNLGCVTLQAKEGDRLITLKLQGGELIQFNCKVLHRAIDVDSHRIGIGLWSNKIPFPSEGAETLKQGPS